MSSSLKAYLGPKKKVVVYDTYAAGGKIHFDVFLATDKTSTQEIDASEDARALAIAQEFLGAFGKGSDDLKVVRCRKCHIDDTDLYRGQLWEVGDSLVWPMEGCPKP